MERSRTSVGSGRSCSEAAKIPPSSSIAQKENQQHRRPAAIIQSGSTQNLDMACGTRQDQAQFHMDMVNIPAQWYSHPTPKPTFPSVETFPTIADILALPEEDRDRIGHQYYPNAVYWDPYTQLVGCA